MTRALIIHLNQSIVLLYQKYKNLLEKVYVGLLIVIDHTNNISKYKPLSGSDYIKLPKITFKRHVDLLLIENEGISHHVLITDFSNFIYNQTLLRNKK